MPSRGSGGRTVGVGKRDILPHTVDGPPHGSPVRTESTILSPRLGLVWFHEPERVDDTDLLGKQADGLMVYFAHRLEVSCHWGAKG